MPNTFTVGPMLMCIVLLLVSFLYNIVLIYSYHYVVFHTDDGRSEFEQ